jgi:hypothetical protein
MHNEKESEVFQGERFNLEEFSSYLKRLSLRMLIRGGTFESFFNLISKFPQCSLNGRVNYLLASGLAIDFYIFSKRNRYHRDIDIVAVNGWLDTDLHFRRIDVVRPSTFWNGLSFEDGFLVSNAIEVESGDYKILMVHPAIILVQKLANKGEKPPREKDFKDVELLVNKFSSLPNEEKIRWWQIINFSLNSFRDPRVQQITKERISNLEKLRYG